MIVTVLLACPAIAIGQTSDTALNVSRFALAAGCALDLSSTVYGVTSGLVVEGNALLKAVAGDVKAHPVLHPAITPHAGRRRMAFWIGAGAAAANVAFGIWNLQQIRQAQSRANIPPSAYSIAIAF